MTDLNVSRLFGLRSVCSNGEQVSGHTYLQRAGVGLKLAANAREADKKLAEILIAVKRKADTENG